MLTVEGEEYDQSPSLEFAGQDVVLSFQRNELPALKAAFDAIKEPTFA